MEGNRFKGSNIEKLIKMLLHFQGWHYLDGNKAKIQLFLTRYGITANGLPSLSYADLGLIAFIFSKNPQLAQTFSNCYIYYFIHLISHAR